MSEAGGGGRWSLNLQTIVLLGSIAGVLASGGYMFSGLQTATDRNSQAVERLALGLEQNDSKTAQLDLRLEHVEAIAEDAIRLRRELDATLSGMRSDIAVIKSMLEKEKQQSRPP